MKFWQTVFILLLLLAAGILFILHTRNPDSADFSTPKIPKSIGHTLRTSARKVFPVDESSQRVELLRRQCRSPLLSLVTDLTTNQGRVDSRILVDPKHKLSYCNVPKIGSSFWYSAFAVLHDGKSATRSPYDMWDKYGEDLHRKVKVTLFKQLPMKTRDDWLQDSLLFLFVRDPYSRLFSAYVNKFVTPNSHYWLSAGKVAIRYNRPQPSTRAMKCGHDLTFQEFLRYFLATESPGKQLASDHHWTPIYKLCNPCHYNYKFIGKTETFLNDTMDIIKRGELGDKIDFQQTGESAVKAEIVKTVEAFVGHSVRLRKCVDIDRDLWRLWYAFKAKGYLKPDSKTPQLTEALTPNNVQKIKEELYRKALQMYEEQSFPGSQAQYRKEFLTKAFFDVPQQILMAVRKALLPDFLLFGYNPQPVNIFPNQSIFNDDDFSNL